MVNATKCAVQPINAAAEAMGLRFKAKAIMTDEAGEITKIPHVIAIKMEEITALKVVAWVIKSPKSTK